MAGSKGPPLTLDAPSPKSRFIKVKRRADEGPLPLLVLEEGGQTSLYLLSSSADGDTSASNRRAVSVEGLLAVLKVLALEGVRPLWCHGIDVCRMMVLTPRDPGWRPFPWD